MSTAKKIDTSYLTRPDCKDLDHIPGTMVFLTLVKV